MIYLTKRYQNLSYSYLSIINKKKHDISDSKILIINQK